jgi:DNA polymerase-1
MWEGAAVAVTHLADAVADLPDGALVAVALCPGVGAALASSAHGVAVELGPDEWVGGVQALEASRRPRWVMWSSATAVPLVRAGVRVARSWDLAAVHRLLHGGWPADPATVWAAAHGLEPTTVPTWREPDLFDAVAEDRDRLVRGDGHLDPGWVRDGWSASVGHLRRWAEAAAAIAGGQQAQLDDLAVDRPRIVATARSESTAELLCAELSVDGLPLDVEVAEALIAGFVGPRPRSETDAAARRAERDDRVLRHAPAGMRFDLRSPGQVRSLLRSVGIEVPDTRAWRLESLRDAHPVVVELLAWRKAERVATTYGYGWLDEHVSADGRLRGEWSGSDGAAGRMTASAGLHNLPADLRGAVAAEPGHVFVRADLGQVEPRVLAAVSGDVALARAAEADDLYAPVAVELGVERATAKVAVLGAMYGQTTGHGALALRGLHASYPVAMAYLDAADRAAAAGTDLRTAGGRLVRMGGADPGEAGEEGREARSRAAARGRYGRNAMVQGAAAELFKVWALTVRVRVAPLGARIVLCLHDELLVHAPERHGTEVARLVDDALAEAARRWAPHPVRFLADTSVIARWSDAKA